MASKWNQYLEQLLAAKLTVGEHRLALTLGRQLLGWKRDDAYLGRQLLRDVSGLDGRSFDRARSGLIAKGLLDYTPGKAGRGNRGHYRLTIKTAATERPIKTPEKGRSTAAETTEAKRPLSGHEKAALQRPRRGRGKGKEPAQSADNELRSTAFETYRAAGGDLLLDRARNALAAGVTRAAKAGHDRDLILDAVRDLGRNREFTGLLGQRIKEFETNGRPCTWAGIGRLNLTVPQLIECGCQRCTERAHTLEAEHVEQAAPR